jgi:GNAT superfamily N-acetyltransferase
VSLQLVRIDGEPPAGFERLRAEAAAAGYRHMDRFAEEWARTPRMFHALLAAFAAGELVGLGAITDEPVPAGEPAWRMRRLYVAKAARGAGVGRTLANALLQEALDNVRLVTVHAGDAAAGRFWQALGFRSVEGRPWSHEYRG